MAMMPWMALQDELDICSHPFHFPATFFDAFSLAPQSMAFGHAMILVGGCSSICWNHTGQPFSHHSVCELAFESKKTETRRRKVGEASFSQWTTVVILHHGRGRRRKPRGCINTDLVRSTIASRREVKLRTPFLTSVTISAMWLGCDVVW